jgi:tyrosyl-tRNA synthetase
MSIPDSLMREWFELCTDLPAHEITLLCDSTQTHPRAAKERLAIEIVTGYHSAEAAAAAVADFKRRFSDGLLPEHIEDVPVSSDLITDGRIGILNLIKSAGFAASTSEARRLVEGGGVLLAGCKITDPRLQVTLAEKPILQVGKRRVARMIPPG